MSEPATEITVLGNGLRVATVTMPHLETASIGVWLDVGARHEQKEINGVSHLLEHMAFKGTERRTAKGIAEEIEDVGGHLNAYTSRENTAYYARVLGDDVPLAADILADILQHSTLVEEELDRERAVIVQEIGQVNDTPDDLVFDLFQETAYPDQAFGRSILGPAETVETMPRADILGYMRRHYGAGSMVLSAAGAVEHARVVDLADKLLGGMPAASDVALEPARYVGGDLREERDLEQIHVILGVEAMAYHDPDFYALQLYSSILGGGMSSRLFQEVREKRGLAYSVYSFVSSAADSGMLAIYAGTGADEVAEAVQVIGEETRKLAHNVSEAEIARARNQFKASLLMGLESCSAVSEDVARQLLVFGRRLSRAEIIAKLDAVDEAAIRRVSRRLFTDARPTLTAIGPLDHLPSSDRIRAALA